MENQEHFEDDQESEYEDSLSFCNFSMQDHDHDKESSPMQSPRDSSAHEEFFEFLTTNKTPISAHPDIIFCGKTIHKNQDHDLNEYQKRDYLSIVRSKSFRKPNPSCYDDQEKYIFAKKDRLCSQSTNYENRIIEKVNITSLTSMSAKSRRRMFMFGPVKFKPEMELSAIKERQGRRVRPPMTFPGQVVESGGETVVNGGGKSTRGYWGMMRSLRGRSHFTNVLAKSFGCISLGAAHVEKFVKIPI